MREHETSAPGLGAGTKIVPLMPTEAMWGGLARQIVMWHRFTQPTGAKLYRHLRACGWPIPAWLETEIPDRDHVPPKGSVAVAIYHAMLAAAPPTTMAEAVASARAEGWQPIETAPANKAIQVYVPGLDYYGNGGVYAGMLVDMGTGRRWITFGWAIGRDLGAENTPTHWMPMPAPPILIPGGRTDV